MQRYKRLLVALNLTEQDAATIRYAALVTRIAQAEKIYFAHVVRTLDIPEGIRKEYPDMFEPVDEVAKGLMRKKIDEYFDGHPDTEVSYEIAEGSPLLELLRWSRRKDIDLVITGKKPKEQGGGTIPEKLARKAPCSVLIVPEGTSPAINRILIPVDFSEHAVDAVDVAVAFGTASGATNLDGLHVYHVPTGYYKIGKTYEEFAEIMRRNAETNYHTFISGIDLRQCSLTPLFELNDRPAMAIEEVLSKRQSDLLVMGARGRSAAAAVLLGSVTERLVRTTEVPLIAVKKKGETFGLLDAILGL